MKFGKRQSFYITIRCPERKVYVREEKQGYIIDESYAKIVLHKAYRGWEVSEYYSGARMCDGNTRQDAWNRTLDRVVEHSAKNEQTARDYVRRLVKGYVESFGRANGNAEDYAKYLAEETG